MNPPAVRLNLEKDVHTMYIQCCTHSVYRVDTCCADRCLKRSAKTPNANISAGSSRFPNRPACARLRSNRRNFERNPLRRRSGVRPVGHQLAFQRLPVPRGRNSDGGNHRPCSASRRLHVDDRVRLRHLARPHRPFPLGDVHRRQLGRRPRGLGGHVAQHRGGSVLEGVGEECWSFAGHGLLQRRSGDNSRGWFGGLQGHDHPKGNEPSRGDLHANTRPHRTSKPNGHVGRCPLHYWPDRPQRQVSQFWVSASLANI